MKKIMFNDKFRFTPAVCSPLLRFLPSFGGAGGGLFLSCLSKLKPYMTNHTYKFAI